MIWKVEALTPVKTTHPVQARTLPPLVIQPRAEPDASPDIVEHEERRHEVQIHGERRSYCRRIEHLPVLVELRSGHDRRRRNQRGDDMMEHIDEKA